MKTVVLVHGWGYDASLWDPVRTLLDPELQVVVPDLRFYATSPAVPPAPTFAVPVLAVGHSLGALWWLARAGIPWRRLLCINGFPRFTETTDFAPALAPRLLERMRTQFARDPAAVLADFHARCGGTTAGAPDMARLATGLDWLAQWDGRATLAERHADIWALAGTDDPIVPRAMSEQAFAGLPAGRLEFIDTPGHLLPLTHPEVCARRIESLAA